MSSLDLILAVLFLAIANAACINGLWKAFNEGVLLPIHLWVEVHFKPIAPAISGCPFCMASVHSIYCFWPVALMTLPFSIWMFWAYLIYIPVVSCFSFLIHKHLEHERDPTW